MENKNILFTVYSLSSGGVEQMLLNIIPFLNFKNIYIAYTGKADETCLKRFMELNCKTIKIPQCSLIEYHNKIYDIILKNNIDIVHANNNTENGIILHAAKKAGVKVRIAHSHGMPEKTLNPLRILFRFWKKILCRKTATIKLACSKKAGKYLYGHKKYIIIPNGVNSKKFAFNKKRRDSIRDELKINNDICVLGYIARFQNGKNHIFLLDVFKQLLDKKQNIALLLIGCGKEEKRIKEYILKNNLQNYVTILTPKENIEDYYQAMDIFVIPSKQEGFGMVAVEAQVNNLKCIASTGVSSDTKIGKNIRYIKLNKKLWVQTIEPLLLPRNCTDSTIKNPYDISTQKAKLIQIYIESIK